MMVTVDVEAPADPHTVHRWLTEPDLLVRWWPSEAETDVRSGGEYRMYWAGPDVTLRGSYTDVLPGERLGFTWSWDHDDLPPRQVTITLTEAADGTALLVEHEAGSDEEAGDYRSGWEFFLGRLVDALTDAGTGST